MKPFKDILIFLLKNIYLLVIGIILITQFDYDKINWIGYVFIFEYLGRCGYYIFRS